MFLASRLVGTAVRRRVLFAPNAHSRSLALFSTFDPPVEGGDDGDDYDDGDGMTPKDKAEWKHIITTMCSKMNEAQLQLLVQKIETFKGDEISLEELTEMANLYENYEIPSDTAGSSIEVDESTSAMTSAVQENAAAAAAADAAMSDLIRIPRIFTDPLEISDKDWAAGKNYDDLQSWSPDIVSRVSLNRVKLLEGGVPTLDKLASLALPPPPPPHPSDADESITTTNANAKRLYAQYRKRLMKQKIRKQVEIAAAPIVEHILESLDTWEEKQEAVDELFEDMETLLLYDEDMCILESQPYFSKMVEQCLEDYLKKVQRKEKEAYYQAASKTEEEASSDSTANSNDEGSAETSDDKDSAGAEDIEGIDYGENESDTSIQPDLLEWATPEADEKALPLFMDLYTKPESVDEKGVPLLVAPLKPHPKHGAGRMVEEWDLSAHDESKRILLRQSTREVARLLLNAEISDNEETKDPARIVISGRQGVGKTAALLSIVASARASGNIVLFMPDGNRLRRLGKYIEPCLHREGMFNLPVLSQEVIENLLSSHEADMEHMTVSTDNVLNVYLSSEQIKRLFRDDEQEVPDEISLVDLLKKGLEVLSLAPGVFSSAIHVLSRQKEKPFLMALDEFNCYFDHGHYFHMKYDETVKRAIPYEQINLFRPAYESLGLLSAEEEDASNSTKTNIIVSTTESCSVARKFTIDMLEKVREAGVDEIQVPRYSNMEVDHVIANYEAIGIGRLRNDRGETVMNEQEVAYLRMVSSNIPQKFLDSCIM